MVGWGLKQSKAKQIKWNGMEWSFVVTGRIHTALSRDLAGVFFWM